MRGKALFGRVGVFGGWASCPRSFHLFRLQGQDTRQPTLPKGLSGGPFLPPTPFLEVWATSQLGGKRPLVPSRSRERGAENAQGTLGKPGSPPCWGLSLRLPPRRGGFKARQGFSSVRRSIVQNPCLAPEALSEALSLTRFLEGLSVLSGEEMGRMADMVLKFMCL